MVEQRCTPKYLGNTSGVLDFFIKAGILLNCGIQRSLSRRNVIWPGDAIKAPDTSGGKNWVSVGVVVDEGQGMYFGIED